MKNWSGEIPFEKENIKQNVPPEPGIYKILQKQEYSRYEGVTRILKIGKSLESLQLELLNHFGRHTSANRLRRIMNRKENIIVVIYR